MKILEIERKYSKYNSFVDWFKMENDLYINKYFMPIFFDNGGHVKVSKKNEICFKLEYKEVIYEFSVTDFFMTFKINNIMVGDYTFLDAYRYKNISTRNIYYMINTIVKLLIDNEKISSQYNQNLMEILNFGVKTMGYIPNTIVELSDVLLFYNNKLKFLQYTYLDKIDFYRVRTNVTSEEVLKLEQCLAPPKEYVCNRERLNETKESVLYGSLFFPNACMYEAHIKKLDKYILVEGELKKKLKLAFFCNPMLEYFMHIENDNFLDALSYIFKMNVVEKIFKTTKNDNYKIYEYTNFIKKYANSIYKWHGYIYYSTLTIDNYNIALNRNDYVKIKYVYECEYLNEINEYNQVIKCNKRAVVSNKKLLWNNAKVNHMFLNTNFPNFDFMNDAIKYLNVDLRRKEIENGDPLEFDEYGNKLK